MPTISAVTGSPVGADGSGSRSGVGAAGSGVGAGGAGAGAADLGCRGGRVVPVVVSLKKGRSKGSTTGCFAKSCSSLSFKE